MRIVESFPHSVREIENLFIPLPDGCRLAARAWLPEGAEATPVPAIVEYIPYRKRDGTRHRDEPMHHYFAGHGYAALRIDLRGSGDSDGLLLDEYLPQEQEDGAAALAWIAAQPWCSGKVGMMGKSWGGFNSLQVAALAPPELAAVITVCSTDDRYADDAHYMGGCLLNENLTWGSLLFTLNALPPDPEVVGDRWREMWHRRLAAVPLFAETWLRHPHRDDYWRQGSVAEDLGRIVCPVFAVGGWADGYSNAIPRLLAGLGVPRRGLIGPWAHVYPHEGVPGPAIGFLQEALRWWDHWLKGVDTGLLDEPMLTVWMADGARPPRRGSAGGGRWAAEERWPSPRIEEHLWELPTAGVEPIRWTVPVTASLASGSWCSFGDEGLAGDQGADDAASLTFDFGPLAEDLEILGAPIASLTLAADREVAQLVARLCDVAPGGASQRVSYGVLNLCHRDGHSHPRPLVPGERCRVAVRLNDAAHRFPAGHRVRLAIAGGLWPIVWPAPARVELTLWLGASSLTLPVRPSGPGEAEPAAFGGAEAAAPAEITPLHPVGEVEIIERDEATGEITLVSAYDVRGPEGVALSRVEAIDLEVGHAVVERLALREGAPLSARAEIEHRVRFRRGRWSARIETHTRLTSSAEAFHLEAELNAWEGDVSAVSRRFRARISRDLL